MNKRNGIILGLLFVIIVVEILVLAPQELGISPAPEDTAVAVMPTPKGTVAAQTMKDVHLVEAKPSGKEWEIWASRAVRPHENEEWVIEQVKVKFFAEDGVTYTVTGSKGNVVPTKNDIRIEGKVVTRSSNGYVFRTESVFYDSKNRRLASPEAVSMTSEGVSDGGLELTGMDMTADLGTNEIEINRNVRAKREIQEGKIATIQSEKAVLSGRSNMAQFLGNVTVDVDTMRVTGPEAKFVYDSKTQKFESVDVVGGVRVTDTDKLATSASVSVHFKEEKVVFRGLPRVVQNGDELVGDEIVFLEGGRKVQVSNARARFDSKSVEKRK